MPDPNKLYDLGPDNYGDHYFGDGKGGEYNDQGQETNWSKRNKNIQAELDAQEEARQQAAAEQREAQRNANHQMVLDAVDRSGGILARLMGRPSAGRSSLASELFRPLNSLESFIIKAAVVFMIGFVAVYTVYYAIIEPVTKGIKSGVRSVKLFFFRIVEGFKFVINWIWNGIVWFFKAWPSTLTELFGKSEFGFFKAAGTKLILLLEIAFAVLLLYDMIKRCRNRSRRPEFSAIDAYAPVIVLFILEFLYWLIAHSAVWTFPWMLYNTLCLSAWLIIAELVILYFFRKKQEK